MSVLYYLGRELVSAGVPYALKALGQLLGAPRPEPERLWPDGEQLWQPGTDDFVLDECVLTLEEGYPRVTETAAINPFSRTPAQRLEGSLAKLIRICEAGNLSHDEYYDACASAWALARKADS
jgi:hypothetical protein